jgi:hypothetical protein
MLCAEAMAQTGLPSANTASLSVTPEKRIALVIGNAKYKDAPLANPVNDAHAMAKALGETGFAVTELDNAGQQEMQLALRKFYFAGHGMQVKGRNSLIPVDAEIEREDEVAYKSLDVGQVLEQDGGRGQSAQHRYPGCVS